MSGIRTFRFFSAALAAFGGFFGAPLLADELQLSGDAHLSGDVRAIHEDGSVELVTPLAPEPLRLKPDAVRRVDFSAPEAAPALPSTRLELINGDLLPVQIESLEGDSLIVDSPLAGRLEIPRHALKSLHLGVYPERHLYSGGAALSGWSQTGGWSSTGAGFEVEGQGRLSRDLPPAETFIIRFTLEWRNNPSFRLFFADPMDAPGTAVDRYFLQFNHSGLEIKRESVGRKRYASLGTWARQPTHYAAERVEIEVRVDRRQQLLELLVNGEPEGRMFDPIGSIPTGNGIALESNANNNTWQRVTGLEVLHWDADGDRHRTEERGNPEHDTLISAQGDRMEGALLAVRGSDDDLHFLFESEFLDSPAEILEDDVSTVFFSRGDESGADAAGANHPFALRLHGGGVLRVASCSFSGERVEARHPLLGQLSISRAGVTAFERTDPLADPRP